METQIKQMQELVATTSRAAASWFATLSPAQQYVFLGMSSVVAYALFMWTVRIYETRKVILPPTCKGFKEHGEDVEAVLAQIRHFFANRKPGQAMSINRSRGGHEDSNRTIAADYKKTSTRVDVSRLDGVIGIESHPSKGHHPLMHMEPGLPMDTMARVALAHGYVPQVVLEFPGITAGGAVCGGGIESSSHAYGSFFDTVEEVSPIDVLCTQFAP